MAYARLGKWYIYREENQLVIYDTRFIKHYFSYQDITERRDTVLLQIKASTEDYPILNDCFDCFIEHFSEE
jgi:hypothetical protein